MAERVEVTVEDHVAHVRMRRPDKRNALDLDMFTGLVAAGEELKGRADVRAVVLSGEGPCFCAGMDFPSMMARGLDTVVGQLTGTRVGPANPAQRMCWIWRELPMPVIAAVHGVAFGGGLQLAAGADIRLIDAETRLSVMEIKWGLIPDMGITRLLDGLVRLDVLKELTWTGRQVVGEEAVRLGLATRVVEDPLAAALELARSIAGRSPHAIRAAKTLYHDTQGMDDLAALSRETELQLPLLGSPNQLEAVMANFQKRPPVFQDVS